MAKSIREDSESAYEYDQEYNSDDNEQNGSDAESEYPVGPDRSVYSQGDDDLESYLDRADEAMKQLENLHSQQSSSWKKVLTHRSGVVVFQSKEKSHAGPSKRGGKGYYAPVFKGEHDIKNFSPAAVFGVVGTRKLWDPWYKEGNLVQNLSDNSSLTYMCMKGITGSSTRDLSLVEKVQGSATGSILFCSSSVDTPRVPRVSGRVRAKIALNGWVLEPIDGGTRVSYYLLVNVKTFVPNFAAMRYLARRPTCIAKIDEYLQSHGPPPMAGVDSASTTSGSTGRKRRDSTSSQRSRRSTRSSAGKAAAGGAAAGAVAGGFIAHVKSNTDTKNYGELQKGQKLFRSLLESGGNDWKLYKDQSDTRIFIKEKDSEGLPAVKGEASIGGVTTEQVLGTILCGAARVEWDKRYLKSSSVELENGFDQGVFVEAHKGIFPILGERHFTLIQGVERDDEGIDNGDITLVSRSTKAKAEGPKGSELGQIDVSGWQLVDDDGAVRITHIAQKDINGKLTGPARKILISEIARGPSNVAEFIDDYGYAPFFVRWGAGPAQLENDDAGDLKNGNMVFHVGGEGKGTMKDGQQKCWLQYSDKMFERGIEIDVEPKGAAELAKVDGIDRTIQFAWTKDVKKGAKVTLKRADGDGAEDVYVGGKFLDATVAMEGGGVAGGGSRKKSKRAAEGGAAGAAAGGGGAAAAASSKAKQPKANGKQVNGDTNDDASSEASQDGNEKQSSNKGLAAAIAAPAAVVGAAGGALATSARKATGSVAPNSVDQEQVKKQGTLPEDACLIISQDLYFTRQQCVVMAAIMMFAFLWGKFA